jgi:sugar-specific transcriptional regulator TrmB
LQRARSGVSQEKILKTLESLGLTQWDAKVYIILAKRGPIKASDAAKALKLSKQRLYPIVKSLQSKGIVNSTLERPARFSAVPFEKVLDLFVKAKIEQAQRIQQKRDELLSDWQSIAIAESDSPPAKFTVIEGRSYIYSKIQQMIQDTESHLSFVATVPSLARADQFGLFDAAFSHPLKSKIQFRFITELSEQNANALKALLKKIPKADFSFEGKTPDLGLKLCPRMVIRDEEEAVFFIDPRKGEFVSEQDDVCLWTNCKSLVQAFTAVFEDLWRNSTEIQKKIEEIETGKPTPKTYVISDAEAAKKKYEETVQSAKEEIIMMTSSKGLIECWKSIPLIKKWIEKGVSVEIMAPIVSENLEVAEQLSKICAVRHVSISYWGTTIVDGKHLFQFKAPRDKEKLELTPYFENTFYTNDFAYVERMKATLNDIWKTARAPSAVTLESILRKSREPSVPLPSDRNFPHDSYRKMIGFARTQGFSIEGPEQTEITTERDVLNKIITAQKSPVRIPSKDINRWYGSLAAAVIHPPNHFNLPDMLIQVFHIEKQSALGEEDVLSVSLWLETPTGHAYVPVALIGDNPKAQGIWKATQAGTPAGQNVQLVKKGELQVSIHGNTLFAGWTVQIPLLPPYVLPPACILFEGYGDIKTDKYTLVTPSGYRTEIEQNGFDAFVTFFHPSSKYSGPGTDGFFGRDFVAATSPPSTS